MALIRRSALGGVQGVKSVISGRRTCEFRRRGSLSRRTLLELVGQYDSYARLERDQVSLGYSIALLELEIARDRGLLVDGARM